MSHEAHQHQSSIRRGGGGFWRSRSGLVLLGFLAIGGFFLLTEHTAHVFGALPYLFLLSCVFMHFLMHGGHGGHGGSPGADESQR